MLSIDQCSIYARTLRAFARGPCGSALHLLDLIIHLILINPCYTYVQLLFNLLFLSRAWGCYIQRFTIHNNRQIVRSAVPGLKNCKFSLLKIVFIRVQSSMFPFWFRLFRGFEIRQRYLYAGGYIYYM